MIVIDTEPQRLVPLDTWTHENARNLSIWWHGSPHLTGPDGMGKWLKRHEAALTERGDLLRIGIAWRIIEPTFKPIMFTLLTGERDKANAGAPRKRPTAAAG